MVPNYKLLAAFSLGVAALVSAAGPAEPGVVLSKNALTFSNQAQGTASTPQIITLSSAGAADLVIASIAITGQNAEDFAETNNCPASPAVLAPSANCNIEVTFKPTNITTLTAALTITDNAAGSPRSVSLKGTATASAPAVLLSPAALNFGTQPSNTTSAARTVLLVNAGSAMLNLTNSIAIDGANATEFSIVAAKTTCPNNTGEIPEKGRCEIAVAFRPADLGSRSAQLTIVDDAPGSPHVVSLAGVGVPAPPPSKP
jgi:hypothetical protein